VHSKLSREVYRENPGYISIVQKIQASEGLVSAEDLGVMECYLFGLIILNRRRRDVINVQYS